MKADEHRLLSHTGAGTPLGELLRRYWTPALLSRELEMEGAPVRVRLLGENLIAFRNRRGQVGLLAENCAHRGASLYFAKNAEDGLRCWYHGWKYDVEGKCLEQPNEPPQTQFCDRVHIKAYPCVERSGVVWTYMGPSEKKPALPDLEWLMVPESHVFVSKRFQECSWLQGMEGDLDSSHVGILHAPEHIDQSVNLPTIKAATKRLALPRDNNPKMEAVQLPSGMLHAARREGDAANHYWRIGTWFIPYFTMIPGHAGDSPLGGHAWVPIDDERCFAYAFSWHPTRALTEEEVRLMASGSNMHSRLQPGTFIPLHNKRTGYGDPAAAPTKQPWQRIRLLQDQDVAMTESIGPYHNRALEHLGSTDIVILQMRRRLMAAARSLAAGEEAPGTNPKDYRIRPYSCLLPRDTTDWVKAAGEALEARPETFRPSV